MSIHPMFVRYDTQSRTVYLEDQAVAYWSSRHGWLNLVGYNEDWPLHMAVVNAYYWYDLPLGPAGDEAAYNLSAILQTTGYKSYLTQVCKGEKTDEQVQSS